MSDEVRIEDVLRLPREERLKLVQEIWDSLGAESAAIPVPDWHREELDRRLAAYERDGEVEAWSEVKKRLEERSDQTSKP